MLGNMLGGFIVILVGTSFIGTIGDSIYGATWANKSGGTVAPTNVSGTAATVLNMTTTFFALGVMGAGISLAVGGLKNAGVI